MSPGSSVVKPVLLGIGVALLVGCSPGEPSGGASSAASPRTIPSSSAPSAAAVSPSAAQASRLTSAPPVGHEHEPDQATPRASSGPLNASTVPTPDELGPGWESRIEGADVEAGPGNGTPYQERDPVEIVQTTVPLGCVQQTRTDVPAHVLQSTYRHTPSGAYAVIVRMSFDSPGQAERFVRARHRDMAACRSQPDDPYSGLTAPVRSARSAAGRSVARYRLLGEQAAWLTGARVQGSDVLTLDANPRPADLVGWQALGFLAP